MRRGLLLLLCLLLLCGCERQGNVTILYPPTSDEMEETRRAVGTAATTAPSGSDVIRTVTVNRHSGVFHIDPTCARAADMAEENRLVLTDSVDGLKGRGYRPCRSCSAVYADAESGG